MKMKATKTKKCKSCGSVIEKKKKKCPYCGKKQGGALVTVLWVFVLFCVALTVIEMAGRPERVDGPNDVQNNETVEIETEETETEVDDTHVSYEAEIVLMQIAEDIAKQIAQNPGTVEFKTMYWGFAREGTTYAVQGTFECSNLLGVTEEHDLQVWCEASEDYSSIQPYEVYLDGEKII